MINRGIIHYDCMQCKILTFCQESTQVSIHSFYLFIFFFSEFAADGLIIDSRVEAFALGFALTSEKIIWHIIDIVLVFVVKLERKMWRINIQFNCIAISFSQLSLVLRFSDTTETKESYCFATTTALLCASVTIINLPCN